MLWLNIDKPTGVWRLHRETCRFCNPKETKLRGVNRMKKDGGWIHVESYTSAYEFYETDRRKTKKWKPCKECRPEK